MGVINVPEQIGKICPVAGDLTINAPVLLKLPFESTKPYVMAWLRGVPMNKATAKTSEIRQNETVDRRMINLL